ncbi:MAG: ferrochelatase [Chlamydiia bacterium]|nr:ferrochelatase [Chlamydiia bacterium]
MILVNFGGPRNLEEIAPFLEELLSDQDVVATPYPAFFHRWLFKKIARKRAARIVSDYVSIGNKSPIYEDTEAIGAYLKAVVFHRYLPSTHASSLSAIEALRETTIPVLPLFPQFSYATTGSIARFFQRHLRKETVRKLQWVGSYCDHPAFIASWQRKIKEFVQGRNIPRPFFLFSAHGLPQAFVQRGDPYQAQCERSVQAVMRAFPDIPHLLAYQSKFGRGEWLRPYTNEVCESWNDKEHTVVIIPISFTSDHIETLFEIEEMYVAALTQKGVPAYRCPALNREKYWLESLQEIARYQKTIENFRLVRRQILRNHVGSMLP